MKKHQKTLDKTKVLKAISDYVNSIKIVEHEIRSNYSETVSNDLIRRYVGHIEIMLDGMVHDINKPEIHEKTQ